MSRSPPPPDMTHSARLVVAATLTTAFLCGCGKITAWRDGGQNDQGTPLDQGISLLVDETFEDFSKGSFTDDGVKAYASRRGRLVLIDRIDLNGDREMDMVVTNSSDGKTNKVSSFLVWGGNMSNLVWSKLPTLGAAAAAVADLDDDGYPDVVFANQRDGSTHAINSYVYWGDKSGVSAAGVTELPTVGARDVTIADLDGDGYLDVAFANGSNGKTTRVNSYVYRGAKGRTFSAKPLELPTLGARGVTAGDVTGDGRPDLLFANHFDDSSYTINSYIYKNDSSGFSPSGRLELPTVGAHDVNLADMNTDGSLDIIFSNHTDGKSYEVDSFIYWGGGSGYSTSRLTKLPTHGATSSVVTDLRLDEQLDVVFANQRDDTSYKVNSFVYLGPFQPPGSATKLSIPTVGARGVLIGDYNRDVYPEVTFCSHGDSVSDETLIYSFGTSIKYHTSIKSQGATRCVTSDPGAQLDRDPKATFTSRVFDTGLTNPTYLVLAWKASTPLRTALNIQLRSGADPASLTSAHWYGPFDQGGIYNASQLSTQADVNQVHNGQRYIQYRAVLRHDFTNTPVLDRLQISFKPGKVK